MIGKTRRTDETGKQLVVVLVGSPKGIERSKSAQLAKEVLRLFSADEWDQEWVHAHAAVRDAGEHDRLLELCDRASLILLTTPLYVDSLPAPATSALQAILDHRAIHETPKHVRFAALLNCGFLEPHHNVTCLRVCETFSQQAGLEWMGGMMLGSAGATNKRILEGLHTAGSSLASDLAVPQIVYETLGKPIMPRWLYILGGNFMWRRFAKRNGVTPKDLKARPYEGNR